MSQKNRPKLVDRVVSAAEAALAEQHYVSAIDMLVGIRWLEPTALERWRRGQVAYLEETIQTNPLRVVEALELFRSWTVEKCLLESETEYVARTPDRRTLRFTESGDPAIEAFYRTHWVSPTLSGKKREHLAEKASRAPELVVIQPLNTEWKCHRCGGTGGLLMMEDPGPICLGCAGLGDLEYLPAGDALLSRRAKAKSKRYAVVVRFSRSRRRYERQGLLVEPQALAEADPEVETSRPG